MSMLYDLTFEEPMDILKNRIGWVQGERFDEHEYLTIDRRTGYLIESTKPPAMLGRIV